MLVITRRIGEKIIINDNIHITINEVRGRQVRVAFDAPLNVVIHREEIYKQIAKKTIS